jgi:hypothetical protein
MLALRLAGDDAPWPVDGRPGCRPGRAAICVRPHWPEAERHFAGFHSPPMQELSGISWCIAQAGPSGHCHTFGRRVERCGGRGSPPHPAFANGSLMLRKDWRGRFCVASVAAAYIFIRAMRRHRMCRLFGQYLKRMQSGYAAMQRPLF